MNVSIASPLTFSGPADANPVGTQIGNWSGGVTNKTAFDIGNCMGSYAYAAPVDIPISGLTHESAGVSYPVYATGIPGIGYVIGIKDPNASNWVSIAPPQTQTYPAPGMAGGAQSSLGFTVQIKLVATGPVATGSHFFPPRLVANMRALDRNKQPVATTLQLYLSGFIVNVTSSGCRITQGADQAIKLPSLPAIDFKGVGSSAGTARQFTVGIACDPNVAIYATMTDVSNPSNTGDFLSLGAGSSAAGVGVQLHKFNEAQPIRFGPDSSRKGNVNQWPVGKTASGAQTFSIPFEARYVQTGAVVKPGSVNAMSTITFSYQ
ncbi:fimbrial protein [Burkholderia ubonensis]|uniref:fimbrial protein n=1 Tax=Burkholderia ubonensis TaxID=101571 RepID=UPI0012F7E0BE|nr:fimbrial protein [Burkholderia ubonensis]